jgi:glyoxylase-like metal-dependent hydrolase (beta-lactamase superfamily II)
MKKSSKKILTVIGIVVLIFAIISVGFFFKMKSLLKDMNPIPTEQIVGNIFSIHDSFVNMFIVKDSNQFIAIDAGNNAESVSQELVKLSINPNNVIAVFLTHSDGDHVGAIKLFKNAKVYLSKQEEQMINGQKARMLIFKKNKIDAKNYYLIEDQQILKIGNIKIQGNLTPGHTPGSMCYLINDKFLFTGDLLGLKNGRIGKFNEFFNMDTDEDIKSIGKITKLPDAEYIFTAHNGFTNNYKDAVKDWR